MYFVVEVERVGLIRSYEAVVRVGAETLNGQARVTRKQEKQIQVAVVLVVVLW
jgi:hypothetical protein